MTAGADRLRGERYCQTKIAKEVSPFHSALVYSIKTSADDTLWGGLLKQRLVENRYNEIEPHDCLPKSLKQAPTQPAAKQGATEPNNHHKHALTLSYKTRPGRTGWRRPL